MESIQKLQLPFFELSDIDVRVLYHTGCDDLGGFVEIDEILPIFFPDEDKEVRHEVNEYIKANFYRCCEELCDLMSNNSDY